MADAGSRDERTGYDDRSSDRALEDREARERGGAAAAGAPDRDRTDRERIARRAYERFEARGRQHGHDQEDWYEAEREAHERQSD